MPDDTTELIEQGRQSYFDAIMQGNRQAANSVALGMLHIGVSPEVILTDVIGSAQSMVGLAWQDGSASVSQEHRASAITEFVVQTLADEAAMAPGVPAEGSAGSVIVACTEGEWHVLPGRLASAVLRLHGFAVNFVGPSLPAEDLAFFIDDEQNPVVALTCVMPLSLSGAWNSVSEIRRRGATVMTGGRGFGPNGQWSAAIGADFHANSFAQGAQCLAEALRQPRREPRDPFGEPTAIAEVRSLRRNLDSFVESATQAAIARWPQMLSDDRAVRATREDLDASLRCLASAVIVGDDAVTVDYIQWLESVLAARSLPLDLVPSGLAILGEVLPADFPLTRAAAERGLSACQETARPAEAGS